MEIFAPPLNLGRNLLLNGNFAINQRAYASGGALAANGYAHDRWRDVTNAAGTSYTFAQATPDTTITVTAGALLQAVEPAAVVGGSYVLSWQGSCPMIAYVTTASGVMSFSSATSPIVLLGVSANTSIHVQTNGTGTLGLVQLEAGTTPTPFERRPIGLELLLCQRFFFAYKPTNGEYFFNLDAQGNANLLGLSIHFPITMRATPTITFSASSSGTFSSGMPAMDDVNPLRVRLRADGSSYAYLTALTASAEL